MPKQLIFFEQLKELAHFQRQMAELFKAFVQEFSNFSEYSRKAKELEHQADMKAHEIIDQLNKTFITPIDREDLYMLAHQLDEVIDLIENIIHNFELYEVKTKIPAVDKFAEIIVQASLKLEELVDHFQEQKRSDYLLQLKVSIHELEDQGDQIFQDAIHTLFKEEKDPIAVIKWKDILENMEELMDQYQSVGDIFEGVIVKAS